VRAGPGASSGGDARAAGLEASRQPNGLVEDSLTGAPVRDSAAPGTTVTTAHNFIMMHVNRYQVTA
jgi:hypothetical protein